MYVACTQVSHRHNVLTKKMLKTNEKPLALFHNAKLIKDITDVTDVCSR